MQLKTIREYTKKNFNFDGPFYIGKIDNTKEKAICFYHNKTPMANSTAIGGKANKSYTVNAVTILLRYGQNADIAEQKAEEIQAFFDEKTLTIDNKRVFVISRYEKPIPLGTDDKGIYEYSFMFDFYETKE